MDQCRTIEPSFLFNLGRYKQSAEVDARPSPSTEYNLSLVADAVPGREGMWPGSQPIPRDVFLAPQSTFGFK